MLLTRSDSTRYRTLAIGVATAVAWCATWLVAATIAVRVPHDLGSVALVGWVVASVILGIFRPVWGLYLLFAVTLLIEQNDPTDGVPLFNARIPFFWDSSAFSSFPIPISPAEFLLGAIAIGGVWSAFRRDRGLSTGRHRLTIPTIGLALVLAIALARGVAAGGDVKVALWEIRGLTYVLTLCLVIPTLIRTRRQVEVLVWLFIVGIVAIAIEGAYVGLALLNGQTSLVETLVGHDDAVHLAASIVFTVALVLLGGRRAEKFILIAACPLILYVLVATRRRDALVALGIGLAIVTLLRVRERPREILRFAAIGATLAVLVGVLSLFPFGQEIVNQPVRAVTSVFAPTTQRDAQSNQYRNAERAGLLVTIRRSPIIGIGFGQRYDVQPGAFYIGVPLFRYITHDDILRFWAKTGAFGSFVFWIFCGVAIVEGVLVYRRTLDPHLKAVVLLAICLISMQLVVHTVDMAMTFYRSMILLGLLIGCIPVIGRLHPPPARAADK